MADGVEGSAVVDKRDHRLLPGPKHGIHQQSQQKNVVATATFSTETSLCLGQPRLNSISHAVQNQHGQQLIAVAHESNCSVIAKVDDNFGGVGVTTAGGVGITTTGGIEITMAAVLVLHLLTRCSTT